MRRYICKQEQMDGKSYYMIYVRWFWCIDLFWERCNTREQAVTRLAELRNPGGIELDL